MGKWMEQLKVKWRAQVKAKWRDQIKAKWKEHAITVLIVAIACTMFLINVSENYQVYHEGSTLFTVTHDDQSYTPPLTVCASFLLNPSALSLEFGLDLNVSSKLSAIRDLRELKGIASNTSLLHLMDRAMWPLGSLIEEVSFGRVNEIYDMTTKTSPIWEQSLKNVLCHQLKPMPVMDSNTLMIRRRDLFELAFFYENKTHSINSKSAEISIISSFLKENFYITISFPSLTTEYILNNWASSEKLFWEHNLVTQFYSVNSLELYKAKFSENCKINCYVEKAKSQKLCFTKIPVPGDQLNKPCKVLSLLNTDSDCLKKCGSQVSVDRWHIMEKGKVDDSNIHKIILKGGHKVIKEKEIYTKYNFYSDFGGSLGLFLGVSFMSVFTWSKNLLKVFHSDIHDLWLNLVSLSVHLILFIITSVHIILSVQEMIHQPPQLSVTLSPFSGREDSILQHWSNETCFSLKTYKETDSVTFQCFNNTDIVQKYLIEDLVQDALAERFAMRAFGCRVPSMRDSLVQCLLTHQTSAIFGMDPYINVTDLPLCTKDMLSFPLLKYVIPTEILNIAQERGIVLECLASQEITSSKMITEPFNFTFQVDLDYFHSYSDMFVETGGIIGLYLGISILSIFGKALRNIVVTLKINSAYAKFLKNAISLILILLTLGISSSQIYVFFLSHPVLTTQSHTPYEKAPVSATVCYWPPLNTDRLLDSVSLSLDAKQRGTNTTYLDLLLEELASKFATNVTLFHEEWHNPYWELSDIKSTFSWNGNWEVLNLTGHKCFKFTPREKMTLFPIPIASDGSTLRYVSFHPRDDMPLLDFHYQSSTAFYKVTRISGYKPLGNKKNENHASCFQSCIQQRLSEKLRCDLPFLENSYKGIQCQYSLILDILKWTFQSKSNIQSFYPLVSHIKNFQEDCKMQCHKCSKTFLHISNLHTKETHTVLGFTIVTQMFSIVLLGKGLKIKEVTEVVDGFPASQLLSQIGGATGVLVGSSIISLLLLVVSYIRKKT